jgi:hypothetical protein
MTWRKLQAVMPGGLQGNVGAAVNKLDRPSSRNFSFLAGLPPLEIRAQYEELPSDLYDADALIFNDSAEMPYGKARDFSRIRNIQKHPLRTRSFGRAHAILLTAGRNACCGPTL